MIEKLLTDFVSGFLGDKNSETTKQVESEASTASGTPPTDKEVSQLDAFSNAFSDTVKEQQKIAALSPDQKRVYQQQQNTDRLIGLFKKWGV